MSNFDQVNFDSVNRLLRIMATEIICVTVVTGPNYRSFLADLEKMWSNRIFRNNLESLLTVIKELDIT